MLILMGNDIGPRSDSHYYAAYIMIIIGAFINANLFGTMAVIGQTFNRKSQQFQQQIDVSNTSMKNMKLPDHL